MLAARDRFYKGDVADELEAWYIATGAFLRKADLAAYETRIEDPITAEYRGYTICKCGPWTQGPVLCQNLRLLAGFDIGKLQHLSADYIHTVTEAMKLGYADRDEYYTDPNFAKVPMAELLSDRYTELRRSLIDPKVASMERRPGDPWEMQARLARAVGESKEAVEKEPIPKQDTTTCVVATAGEVLLRLLPVATCSLTHLVPTVLTRVIAFASMNTNPNHPNRVEAGKRPRITLTPTLVLKDGLPKHRHQRCWWRFAGPNNAQFAVEPYRFRNDSQGVRDCGSFLHESPPGFFRSES